MSSSSAIIEGLILVRAHRLARSRCRAPLMPHDSACAARHAAAAAAALADDNSVAIIDFTAKWCGPCESATAAAAAAPAADGQSCQCPLTGVIDNIATCVQNPACTVVEPASFHVWRAVCCCCCQSALSAAS
jgi:thiol-disulfide isomerase/thioredoxin